MVNGKVGIVGYGAYIPRYRITVDEIARVWNKDGKRVSAGLGVKEKAVAAWDEDSATIAVQSARYAIESSGTNAKDIGAVFVGSESKPYAVKPTATVVAQACGCSESLTAADFEFACKAGTAAVQACMGMVASEMIKIGLAIGTDTAQGRPNDALEFTAGSGGAAFLIGEEKPLALLNQTYSFTTDTPDFWRRQHAEFPKHAGRFTGEPAYFKHVLSAAKGLMQKVGTSAKDYDYAVFHQPNGKFPLKAGDELGFEKKKLEAGLLAPVIGNTYSGASMLGLAAVLDIAKEGDRILCVSYGSGAGSDAFDITVTKEIERKRTRPSVKELIDEKQHVDYAVYAKFRKKIKDLE
ncbi:MAG TPA: hydroxymethylglutaryl-CoA synthase [Candidatus Norongarragalinales archaeon]|nr:hydroxymethylglutaryl-CoA synthase [Candidatus Norongarragalinales archaeon]